MSFWLKLVVLGEELVVEFECVYVKMRKKICSQLFNFFATLDLTLIVKEEMLNEGRWGSIKMLKKDSEL